MRYVGVLDYLPEKAKDSKIENLKERNKILEALVKYYRKRLSNKMKENMKLKLHGYNWILKQKKTNIIY